MYGQLPDLPRDLEMVILRPANSDQMPGVMRQFRRNFHVRQSNIRIWLEHLKAYHPGYRDIVINEDRLRQLPGGEGGDIMDQLVVDIGPDVDIGDLDEDGNPLGEDNQAGDTEIVAVPNLLADYAMFSQLNEQGAPE